MRKAGEQQHNRANHSSCTGDAWTHDDGSAGLAAGGRLLDRRFQAKIACANLAQIRADTGDLLGCGIRHFEGASSEQDFQGKVDGGRADFLWKRGGKRQADAPFDERVHLFACLVDHRGKQAGIRLASLIGERGVPVLVRNDRAQFPGGDIGHPARDV